MESQPLKVLNLEDYISFFELLSIYLKPTDYLNLNLQSFLLAYCKF